MMRWFVALWVWLLAAPVAAQNFYCNGSDPLNPVGTTGAIVTPYATGKLATSPTGGATCSAVAIGPRVVLTAAHCVLPYDDVPSTDVPCDPDLGYGDPPPPGGCTTGCAKCNRWPAGSSLYFILHSNSTAYQIVGHKAIIEDWSFTDGDLLALYTAEEMPGPFPPLYDHVADAANCTQLLNQGYSVSDGRECEGEALYLEASNNRLRVDCYAGVDTDPGDSGGPTYAIVNGEAHLAGITSTDGFVATHVGVASTRDATVIDARDNWPSFGSFGDGSELLAVWVEQTAGVGLGPITYTCNLEIEYSSLLNPVEQAWCYLAYPQSIWAPGSSSPSFSQLYKWWDNSGGYSAKELGCVADMTPSAEQIARGSCDITIPKLAGGSWILARVLEKTQSGSLQELTWNGGFAAANFQDWGIRNGGTFGPNDFFNRDATPPEITAAVIDDPTPDPGQDIVCTVTTVDVLPNPDPPEYDATSGVDYAGCVLENASGDTLSCTKYPPAPASSDDWACQMTVPADSPAQEEWFFVHAFARDAAHNIVRSNQGDAAFCVTSCP